MIITSTCIVLYVMQYYSYALICLHIDECMCIFMLEYFTLSWIVYVFMYFHVKIVLLLSVIFLRRFVYFNVASGLTE